MRCLSDSVRSTFHRCLRDSSQGRTNAICFDRIPRREFAIETENFVKATIGRGVSAFDCFVNVRRQAWFRSLDSIAKTLSKLVVKDSMQLRTAKSVGIVQSGVFPVSCRQTSSLNGWAWLKSLDPITKTLSKLVVKDSMQLRTAKSVGIVQSGVIPISYRQISWKENLNVQSTSSIRVSSAGTYNFWYLREEPKHCSRKQQRRLASSF